MFKEDVDDLIALFAVGDHEAITERIAMGDLNAVGSTGRTALTFAASEGMSEIVELLIKRGASVNAAPPSGMTALHEAAANGQISALIKLLEAGAEVNAEAIHGVTPLMCAAAWGHVNAIGILIRYGADVDHTDERGATAHDIACEKEQNEVAEVLLNAGEKNKSGDTLG